MGSRKDGTSGIRLIKWSQSSGVRVIDNAYRAIGAKGRPWLTLECLTERVTFAIVLRRRASLVKVRGHWGCGKGKNGILDRQEYPCVWEGGGCT